MLGSPILFGEVTSKEDGGNRWQEHAAELVARGGMHESGLRETGMVGEEVACAAWSRSAKGGRKSPNERGGRVRSSETHS